MDIEQKTKELKDSIGKRVFVKLGDDGREFVGKLEMIDKIATMVLTDTVEYMRHADKKGEEMLDEKTGQPYIRKLGLVILRGTKINYVVEVDELSIIDDPYGEEEEED
mmetsp:Transcript_7801/g.11571  ORF Transcript_7801/g.11571 Transcript_7801/m.11571 type:complete len:108 (-) Transcript_7801:54-377(-)